MVVSSLSGPGTETFYINRFAYVGVDGQIHWYFINSRKGISVLVHSNPEEKNHRKDKILYMERCDVWGPGAIRGAALTVKEIISHTLSLAGRNLSLQKRKKKTAQGAAGIIFVFLWIQCDHFYLQFRYWADFYLEKYQ